MEKGWKIVIIILIVLVLGMGGYLMYDKVLKKGTYKGNYRYK